MKATTVSRPVPVARARNRPDTSDTAMRPSSLSADAAAKTFAGTSSRKTFRKSARPASPVRSASAAWSPAKAFRSAPPSRPAPASFKPGLTRFTSVSPMKIATAEVAV